MNLKTGHLLAGGRYKVERVLGQGGFGITYEARDTKFKSRVKSVAIKEFFVENFCNREEGTDRIIVATQSKVELVEKLRNKFIDEANALFELKHPGIVRVTDTFEENGTAYYVMEYINGSTLSSIIETDGPLSEEKALGYIRQAAAVLEYLHGQNRLHLDIKPQNIMVDNDGRVVLIDFGVSKQYDEVKGENTSTLMGYTPGYAPLEQCNNAVVEFTPTTDIYSLGATLYKLLTGQTPPNASEVNENGLPALPPHISAPVRDAIETAMQPRRKDRPQSVGEFLALLDKKVKAENGNVETESNDDGTTIVGGSVMNNEILRSAQNDKEQKSVISSESEKSLENCENEILRSTQNDKKRPDDNAPQRPFNKRPLTIIYVAAICIIAAFFGIKSCNDRKAAEAEAQHAIAEQQRMDAERIAKEAAEKKRKEEAERKRKEEEQKRGIGTINGHEYVDLGLSVKWATCNVGASKPEDYGGYYAWGETEEKDYYDWSTYKWCKGSEDSITKYCINSSYGTVDYNTTLDPEDDVAHVKWGGSWRMPTEAEQTELRNNCTCTWTTQNGVEGYKVTSKKNGNSIFFPAAGFRCGMVDRSRGRCGFYWSSSFNSDSNDCAYYLFFYSGKYDREYFNRRYAQSVRPVCE